MNTCPKCKQPFHCGVSDGRGVCWCMAVGAKTTLLSDTRCLCPSCLAGQDGRDAYGAWNNQPKGTTHVDRP